MIDKSLVSDDIKFSIQNNVVNGKVSSNNMFSSKLYDNNYFLVGLGNKNELTTQKYEKCLMSALKQINTYKMPNISIDISNIKIKNFNTLKGSLIEIEKIKYSYRKNNGYSLKECAFKFNSASDTKQFNKIIKESVAIANGINKARMLGDTPSNICNPSYLAREAKKLEKINKNIKVEILDEKRCALSRWAHYYLCLREANSLQDLLLLNIHRSKINNQSYLLGKVSLLILEVYL